MLDHRFDRGDADSLASASFTMSFSRRTDPVAKARDDLFDEMQKKGVRDRSNGSGVGMVGGDVGIVIYTATDKDMRELVRELDRSGLVKSGPGGTRTYKGFKIGFEVIGEIRAQ